MTFKVEMAEGSSRLGRFCVIKVGQTVLISPCDTRMKILAALAEGPLTSEELRRKIRISYSGVMDHMDFLERIGFVKATLPKREKAGNAKGRRRIYFHLSENPLDGIQELFTSPSKGSRGRSTQESAGPAVPV
ncbi:MAG: winged helix-turn-helix transcriptional regulator [Nitrososphaerota archaeon]|jgi:DNA-binding transcriptional ArsR family regulator|nr:winged helix-turn-helix transcriptional regulator [Nitrososphaerota archaeon]MDG6966124.1 winged helix-turn-helix transcriptional regulator [Nitrososphaerota archaeon]MDG6977559.1 winged helix-turn-helix transcriptional regulator [Nitrososphaerota archaeon]MDG7020797.1 winged helix-turn-helix transcriptional regulator [Nitrososphaerota archaeon]